MLDTEQMRSAYAPRQEPAVSTRVSANAGVVVSASNFAEYRDRIGGFLEQQADLHFYQTLEWYRCSARSHDMFFVLTMSGDKILASSLVRRRRLPGLSRAIYKIERGPVAADVLALGEHLEHVQDAIAGDAVLIAISPFHHGASVAEFVQALSGRGWRPSPRVLAPYESTIVVDLSQEIDRLRAGFRRSLKTQLNRGPRFGVEVHRSNDAAAFDTFVTQHNAMAHRRGLAPIHEDVAKGLREICVDPAGPVELFTAHYEGEQVAGICLFGSGNRVIYEWGVSSEAAAHRQLPLTHMLHWGAVQWAQQAGFRYYDFGGYWDERGDTDPINRFKTGFSKEKQHFVPEHVLAVRPLLAMAYQAAAQLRAGRSS